MLYSISCSKPRALLSSSAGVSLGTTGQSGFNENEGVLSSLTTLNLQGVASIDKELIFNTDNSASPTNTHSVGRGPTVSSGW